MVGIISAQEFQRLIAEREARFEVVDRIRRRSAVGSPTARSSATCERRSNKSAGAGVLKARD